MTDRAESCGGLRIWHDLHEGMLSYLVAWTRPDGVIEIVNAGQIDTSAPQVSEATRDQWERGPDGK